MTTSVRTDASLPTFPPEILGRIVDVMPFDHTTLSSLALVNSTLRVHAQKQIFNSIILDDYDAVDDLAIFITDNPTIALHIRRVVIHRDTEQSGHLAWLLFKLKNIEHYTFVGVHFDSNIVSTLEFNHGHLRGVSFRGCNDIQRALREIHFPLQELEVVHCFTEERWAIDHAVQTDKFMLGYEAVPVFSTSRAALRLGGVQNFVLDNYMSAYVNSVRVQTDVPSMSSKYLAEFAPASQYIVRQLNAFTYIADFSLLPNLTWLQVALPKSTPESRQSAASIRSLVTLQHLTRISVVMDLTSYVARGGLRWLEEFCSLMEQHEIPSQPKVEFVCGSAPTLNLSIPDLADLDARVRTCVLKGHLAEMYSVDFMWNRDDLQTRLSDDEFDKVQQWKFWDEVGAGDFVENWTQ